MTIFIDPDDFKCHTTNPDGTFIEAEHTLFDGKCQTFIEGYRFVPAGKSWTRSDGRVFHGEMLAPWKPYEELAAAQRQYEQEKLADAENALAILLGGETV